jgi:hypothetical protein
MAEKKRIIPFSETSMCAFVQNVTDCLAQIVHIAVDAAIGTGIALLFSCTVVLGLLDAFIT